MADENERGTVFNNGMTIVGVPVAELSDKNRACLAHLEAIEAAVTDIDKVIASYWAGKPIDGPGPHDATQNLLALIRKGMKDNG